MQSVEPSVFGQVERRPVVAAFDGALTDAGGLLPASLRVLRPASAGGQARAVEHRRQRRLG